MINLEILRHSTSHLMAAAVLALFPEAKFGIGPVIENGFYYDFELERTLRSDDLEKIEKKMKELIKEDLRFEKKEMPLEEAMELFKKLNQPYKIELLEDLKKYGTTDENLKSQISNLKPQKTVTIYQLGNFIDLCRGPHLKSTKEIGVFKLLKVAGAYWRGDEKNKMLQRIYGTAFFTQEELNDYLKNLEETEKRDHRELGKNLDFYSSPEELGAGLILWHPKGALVRKMIEDFWKEEHKKRGYQLVYSPHLGKLNLWKKSGHWDFYRDNLYSPIKIENEEYLLKPMNCPFHILIYQSQVRSYRDLPLRYAELGTVYRYERSGVLHGLTRVRGFTQDDAHIFCTTEQLEKEIVNVLKLAIFMMKTFGFRNYQVFLSTRPEKSIGTDQMWERATKALKNALEKTKIKYQIDPGEGVFYGPKIDIKTIDALGRAWQGPTIQVDFNFPERFNLYYIDKNGKKIQPVMIHRTVLGSMERFFGCLIEHYAGALPLWLSPIQIYLAPVGKAHWQASQKLGQEFEKLGLRVLVDQARETISYKVRKAEQQKIPYILVVGDKEIKGKTLNIRERGNKVKKMTKKKFIEKILKEIESKK
ncbi:MAG: threonine--tRNA ligase [Patescibacteria group bacterium]|nr:threonine--tRNA ligase [Patescibacteria group bacterium]